MNKPCVNTRLTSRYKINLFISWKAGFITEITDNGLEEVEISKNNSDMMLLTEEPLMPGKLSGHALDVGDNPVVERKFSSRNSDDLSTTSTEILADALKVSQDVIDKTQANARADNNVMKIMGQPILESVLECRHPVDTVISCADGKIGAHRLVLAAASPFLGMLFEDQKLGEVAIVLLPDIKKNTLEILLHLAYTGTMIFPPEKESDVYAAMECLMFGQMAKLDLSMVKVKVNDATREPQPGTSREMDSVAGASRRNMADEADATPSRDTETRKRRLSSSSELRRKRMSKKAKFDKNGKRIQVAIRTGAPIGKVGVLKLRRKDENRILQEGKFVCKAPFLSSNQSTKTVRLNVKRMPLTSIRLRQLALEEFVCIEVHRQNEWSGNKAEDDPTHDKYPQDSPVKEVNKTKENDNTRKECDTTRSGSPVSPETVKSSGANSIMDIESGYTEVINLTQKTRAQTSVGKDDYSTGSIACSDFERMDLSHRQKKPRSRRRTGESAESSRSKSVIDIDPYEVLEVLSA